MFCVKFMIRKAMKYYFLSALFLAIVLKCVFAELDKIVDLTWNFDNDTIYWIGSQPLVYTRKIAKYSELGYWYAVNEFCAAEHGGTHFDAPYHFNKDGWKVGDVPVERLIAKGVVIDLQNVTKFLDENATLDVNHLEDWEKQNGPFDEGTVLLVKFGYSQYWYNKTKYLGLDEKGKINFPGVSKGAAEWIAKSGKFYGVGLDTASVDPGKSTDFMAHRIFAENKIYHLENVKLTEELPAKGFTVLAMPMKLREGTGAPLRLMAVPSKIVKL